MVCLGSKDSTLTGNGKQPPAFANPDLVYTRAMKIVLAIIGLALSAGAMAHHSFSAEFDSDKRISISGTVTEVRFRNPHVQFFVDIANDGETEAWIVAGQNMVVMRRAGVERNTVKPGDEITVSGYAGRDGAHKIYLDTLVAGDGTRFALYGDDAARKAVAADPGITQVAASPLLESLPGDWAFEVDKPMPGAPLHLHFEPAGDRLRAILDNEEIAVTTGSDAFTIILDRENRAGFPVKLQLTGRQDGDRITGTVEMVAGYTSFPELDARSFSATRSSADRWAPQEPSSPSPFDLAGAWERVIVLGPIGRMNPELTAAGKARHAEFQKGAYDPMLRCIETGPLRRYARRGNIEFLTSPNRITMIYANDNGVRRFWLDRDAHTADRDHDMMGESIARWDGATLVVDTRNLQEAVLTHNAEPLSSDARLIERFWLDEDGQLVMEVSLHDPKYYVRPVVRRTVWQRSTDTEMLYAPCDPDAFYRGLHFDGKLDDYFENQPQ